ncbi:arylesterase [Sphingomonas nostoxanthinifaciens]|uniref:arylesterase n=1 Tax=Sphingomonas nostoxanthinifaciens TaxID=2872652 RepID=UPI001CC207E1|nr:arylesterase [Sphingomonas nostoxanthinifaciens]UAK25073.1 arylesterase [Sphingomonas nostoxanthinifaciens]
MEQSSRAPRYGWQGRLVHLLLALALAWPVQAVARTRLIWAFGDSLTAGYGLPPAQGFTAQLEAALNRDGMAARVANGGVAGDTAAQARARLLWGLRGLGAVPDLAIVELGANDMLRGLPPAQAQANLDMILAAFRARHIPVLLAGMRTAPNLGPDYAHAFEAIYPTLARKYRVPLYPFFLAGVAGQRALIQGDGLHPNPKGVAIVVRGIVPSVKAALR